MLRDLTPQIREGSYLLHVLIPAGLLSSLVTDTARLARAGGISEIDPNRAKVVLRWQERAKAEPAITYAVRSPRGAFAPRGDFQGLQFETRGAGAMGRG